MPLTCLRPFVRSALVPGLAGSAPAPGWPRARAAAAADRVPGRFRSTHPGELCCLPRATASAPGGTSSVTTDPAAVYAPSPMVTGATRTVSLPVKTCAPTVVWCLATPS